MIRIKVYKISTKSAQHKRTLVQQKQTREANETTVHIKGIK